MNYSIEEALKETFNITRRRLLIDTKQKRQVGKFKSRFFDIKERNGKPRLVIKPSFRLNSTFQRELCYYFKRGLYKIYLEELNRQTGKGFEAKYDNIRNFARYGKGTATVLYFNRVIGIMLMFRSEAETPILYFDRMKYLYSNEQFAEIEFLGHVFGFPITEYTQSGFNNYIKRSLEEKKRFFKNAKEIDKLTDVDLSLRIMNS